MAAPAHVTVETTVAEWAELLVESGVTRPIEVPAKLGASAQELGRSHRPRNLPPIVPRLTPRPPSSPHGKKRPQRRLRNGCSSIDCDDSTVAPGEQLILPQSSVSPSDASTAASSGTSTRRPSVSSRSEWSRESSCDIVSRRTTDRLSIHGHRRACSVRCPALRCPDVGATAWSLVFADDNGAAKEARRDDVRTVARELLRKKRGSVEAYQLTAQLEQLKLQSPRQ